MKDTEKQGGRKSLKQYLTLCIPFIVLIVAILWIDNVYSEDKIKQTEFVKAIYTFYREGETLKVPENLNYKKNSAEDYFIRGIDAFVQEEYKEAHQLFHKSLMQPRRDPTMLIFSYYYINLCTTKLTGMGEVPSIANILDFLEDYPPLANNTEFLWDLISTIVSTPANSKKAIALMENYLVDAPNLEVHTKAWIINTIAMIEYNSEDYVGSIRRFYDVEILLAQQSSTPELEYELLFAQEYIANIFLLLENYESAIEMFEELIEREQEEFHNYVSYLQLAESYLQLGNYQKARSTILELQAYLPEKNEREVKEIEATIHDVLANVFMMEGNLYQAQLHLKQTMSFYENNDDLYLVGGKNAASITQAKYLLLTNEVQKAQKLLENLLIANKNFQPASKKEALILLEKIYRETNQKDKLIQVYQELLVMDRDFTQILQSGYLEFSEYYRENSYLRQDNSRLKQNNLMAILVIIIVTSSLTIILVLFRLLSTKNLTDQLTGINNRKKLDQLASLYRRKGTPEFFGVLMIDIDFFKLYNDNYGHLAGDLVLKQVAEMLSLSVRSNDLVIRYGGEEFLVLLTKVTEPIAHSVCNRIHQKLERLQIPHKASKISDYVTVSIGMCFQEQKNTFPLEKLIQQADQALYQSKEGGRNRTSIWKEN